MSNKLTQNLTEATSVNKTGDRVPIYSAASPDELRYMTPDNLVPDASTTVEGKVELATTAETETGTDATRAVTPDGLHDMTTLSGAAWFLDEDTMSSDSAVKVPSQQSVKAYGDRTVNMTLNIHPLYAPRGFLINGVITVTDTGSGLTVAIKTLAGTDPSATNPVYVRIGDTVRSATAAVSRTLADGTNWFNAGSAELATKEIDYFVYLEWDNSNAVIQIGFARVPYFNFVSESSSTTTNELHLAGRSGMSTNGILEVVGRFSATLSAGAGYTWSIPTYPDPRYLIQRPIYETRVLQYTPQITSSVGSFTSVSATATYRIFGKSCYLLNSITITTAGTAAGVMYASMPIQYSSVCVFMGRDNTSTGLVTIGIGQGSRIEISKYDFTTIIASGRGVVQTGTYEI